VPTTIGDGVFMSVVKVYPSAADFDNLSRLNTAVSPHANTFDYTTVVVNKPWGYEYLWYQGTNVAIWMLYIALGQATSLHCHLRKRTSLIVMDGQVVCSTLLDRYRLETAQGVVIEPCAFHTTQAISESGAFVMEVETPPLKGDLARLKDAFGRESNGYEESAHYSTQFADYVYQPMQPDRGSHRQTFRTLRLSLNRLRSLDDAQARLAAARLAVPISGRVAAPDGKALAEAGEAVPACDFAEQLREIHLPFEALIIAAEA
jgi:mannose-6-phosphate isomerase-like protein (cupin superfamily)